MAYAVESDCRLFAPQAPAGETFAGWITQATGVVDAKLRAAFTVPLASTPQVITNIVSQLAAGRYLEAQYGQINQEPPEYCTNLIKMALSELQAIVEDPSQLGIEQRLTTLDDLNADNILVSDRDPGMFDDRDPRCWG